MILTAPEVGLDSDWNVGAEGFAFVTVDSSTESFELAALDPTAFTATALMS